MYKSKKEVGYKGHLYIEISLYIFMLVLFFKVMCKIGSAVSMQAAYVGGGERIP